MKTSTATTLLLIVIYMAFISLGLPDSILGVAWPYIRMDFTQPLEAVGILTIFGTLCSALSSIMSSRVLGRFGTGRVTFVSCLMTATGLLGYAFAPSFLWLLPCIPLLGFGAGSIDCGLNFYVAKHYSSRHMNWLHCCWGIGATLGPIILTAGITKNAGWRFGYLTIGSIQLCFSIILFAALGLWVRVQAEHERKESEATAAMSAEISANVASGEVENTDRINRESNGLISARSRAIIYQISIYLVYTACEFIAGLWAFSLLRNRGVDPVVAGIWVSCYYGALTVARFANGLVVNRLGNRFMIRTGLCIALIGTVFIAFRFFFPRASDFTALAGLVLLGAGFAPIYPCMSHETAHRFKTDTARKIMGYQTGAACIGGAVFPALVGLVGAHTSLEILPLTEAVLIGATLLLVIPLDRLTKKEPI